ncbi:PAS and ANTAR domain-containing protein [Isoptericola halotolerans]|uniref:PAS and ANTAR domain-containing protein n=1 Tax=Isoptericola halotolerans TaxID=300560 RepID=UPI00388DCB8A
MMTTVPPDEALEKFLSRGDDAMVGEFRVDVASGRWTWSDTLYRIYGFEPGEVLPTADLLLAHSHPDDREHTRDVLDEAQCTDHPFAMIHRIVDAHGKGHVVATVGKGECDDQDRVTELNGYMLDLSHSVRDLAAQEADASIQAASRSRRDIEQAKGVLMMVLGVDDDGAFDILKRLSNDTNTPLRTLAGWLMTSARQAEKPSRETVIAFLTGLRSGHVPEAADKEPA